MRKTILITAYAMHPYKGSEDGIGWNYVIQAARFNNIIAVTRCNNKPAIEQFWAENPQVSSTRQHIQMLYFDWPQWMIFWKKGPLLAMLYFWVWQFSLPFWLMRQSLSIDIAHNLNFHSNWTPSFLWLLGKPLIWGPVGHHPKIPWQFILKDYGWKAFLQDRILWIIKNYFWTFDPFLSISKRLASQVLCINSESLRQLDKGRGNFRIMPAIASEPILHPIEKDHTGFHVLSIGRFVPLKGFDMTIRAFARFFKNLKPEEQALSTLTLVGAGPFENQLRSLINAEGISANTHIIPWMPRAELPALYRKASAFLFPSHEGAGMVVIEAMSYGVPVICWNNCGPGESTPPPSTLRVNYGAYEQGVKDFAQRLQVLQQRPALFKRESELALDHFEKQYSWPARGEQLAAIYQTLSPSLNWHGARVTN